MGLKVFQSLSRNSRSCCQRGWFSKDWDLGRTLHWPISGFTCVQTLLLYNGAREWLNSIFQTLYGVLSQENTLLCRRMSVSHRCPCICFTHGRAESERGQLARELTTGQLRSGAWVDARLFQEAALPSMGIANTPASYMWLKHKKYRGDSAFQVRGSSLALKVAGRGCCCLIDTQMSREMVLMLRDGALTTLIWRVPSSPPLNSLRAYSRESLLRTVSECQILGQANFMFLLYLS